MEEELLKILKNKSGILFVGAGTSKKIGYPLWVEFIEDLKRTLLPGFKTDGLNQMDAINKIKTELDKNNRIKEYHKFIMNTLKPKEKNSSKIKVFACH